MLAAVLTHCQLCLPPRAAGSSQSRETRTESEARQLRFAFWQLFSNEMIRYLFREGMFPEAAHDTDLPADRKKVLLFTNVGGLWSEERELSIIDSFKHYDVIFFWSGMFGRSRSPDECATLVSWIHSRFPGC